VVFTELDAILVFLKLENNKSALKFLVRSVFTADDILRVGIGAFGLLEALVELNVFVDRAGDEVTDLSRHQSCNGVAEVLGLVLV
jgi:hypothetical protein